MKSLTAILFMATLVMATLVLDTLPLGLISPASAQALSGVHPLPDPAGGYSAKDFKVFDQVIGKARVVALGESAHGSEGYAQFRFQAVKHLVERRGYRLLLNEMVNKEPGLQRYIKTCNGDLKNILKINPRPEAHLVTVELYRWLCAWNLKHPEDQVSVQTFDPQRPWQDIRELSERAKALQNPLPTAVANNLHLIRQKCFGAQSSDQYTFMRSRQWREYVEAKGLKEKPHRACLDGLKKVQTWLSKTKDSRKALNSLRSFKAWQMKSYYLFKNPTRALTARDRQMAANIIFELEDSPASKAIMLAHNLHVGKDSAKGSLPDHGWRGFTSAGDFLRQGLGADYKAIGLSGYDIRTLGARPYPLPDSERSLDKYLFDSGITRALIETDAAWIENQTPWFMHEENRKNGRRMFPSRQYDAFVFFRLSNEPGPI